MIQGKLGKDTEDVYFEMVDYRKIIQCIGELKEQYRDVLRMRVLHGLLPGKWEIMGISRSPCKCVFYESKKGTAKKAERV